VSTSAAEAHSNLDEVLAISMLGAAMYDPDSFQNWNEFRWNRILGSLTITQCAFLSSLALPTPLMQAAGILVSDRLKNLIELSLELAA
jgi:hypothetical protein